MAILRERTLLSKKQEWWDLPLQSRPSTFHFNQLLKLEVEGEMTVKTPESCSLSCISSSWFTKENRGQSPWAERQVKRKDNAPGSSRILTALHQRHDFMSIFPFHSWTMSRNDPFFLNSEISPVLSFEISDVGKVDRRLVSFFLFLYEPPVVTHLPKTGS